MNLEAAYLCLPIALQNWAVGFEGWRTQQRRYSNGYAEIADAAKARGACSQGRLEEYRTQRLKQHLAAAERTRFWQPRLADCGLTSQTPDPLSMLSRLPVLTKEEVKGHVLDICNPTLSPRDVLQVHTSGTTGSGLIFRQTREMERVTWATWWRYREWHGLDSNQWCAYFGGRSIVALSQQEPPFWRWNRPGRQLLFSGYHLSAATALSYLRMLKGSQIQWMHGYPSMLTLLAGFALEKGFTLPHIRIVTCGAENLMTWQKRVIEDAFGAPVIQHYGQSEGVANISQCPEGRLHVDEDYAGVEFLPIPDLPNTFRIIGTNWHNLAFPLLRYETGDVVALDSTDTCSCGRLGRIVRSIDGRQEDYIRLPNGAQIGRIDHVFKDLVHIREAQLVQRKSGEIVLRIVPRPSSTPTDERKLLGELTKRIGSDSTVSVEYVESIPRTRSGKLRLVVHE